MTIQNLKKQYDILLNEYEEKKRMGEQDDDLLEEIEELEKELNWRLESDRFYF